MGVRCPKNEGNKKQGTSNKEQRTKKRKKIMKNSLDRREFITKSALVGSLAGLGVSTLFAESQPEETDLYTGQSIRISPPESRKYYLPLDEVSFDASDLPSRFTIRVRDGQGNVYQTLQPDQKLSFRAGGALGYHTIAIYNRKDQLTDWAAFPVDCETSLKDDTGRFTELFNMLYETLTKSNYGNGTTVRYNNRYYTYYSSWFQDHVFAAEGLKYFRPDVKTGIDLYADGQREDGLIWDNYKHPYPDIQSYWEQRFDYGGFVYRPEDPLSTAIFVRVPVENMGEHTFIEGLYYAWKATGDTPWMQTKLDNAIKAVEFATSSPYYWSEELQLLKRPYTIDRWDFQSQYDVKITGKGSDYMAVDIDKTHFGIMYGDNTCMANACHLLAEMLQTVGKTAEANAMREKGDGIWKRLNDLSWRGTHYLHWHPLNKSRDFDFGVNPEEQVTLSNAMALIRGLDHDKSSAIIQTYQRIKEEMPDTSPGEWYMCYPPFERGWTAAKWEYMNGGVSPILAGDLALGAFENGFEKYGVDILERLRLLGLRSGFFLDGCYKGAMPEEPKRNFTHVSLVPFANTDLKADGTENPGNWPGGEIADFRNLPVGKNKFQGIDFDVIDPATNQRNSCLVVNNARENQGMVEVSVNQSTQSIYLLHVSDAPTLAGVFTIEYEDGTRTNKLIRPGHEIGHFWYPTLPKDKKGIPSTQIAWKGASTKAKEVGNYVFGMNNPQPEKTIKSLHFHNPEKTNWAIFAISLSDAEHFLEPSIFSTIPAHWGAAHVFKAMTEGMIGIKNTGLAFDKVLLSPKWDLAGVKEVSATAKYECSGGYLSYTYNRLSGGEFHLSFTGNAKETTVEFLLPNGKETSTVIINNQQVNHSTKKVRDSNYVVFKTENPGVFDVKINL
jgi:hypothetical protein